MGISLLLLADSVTIRLPHTWLSRYPLVSIHDRCCFPDREGLLNPVHTSVTFSFNHFGSLIVNNTVVSVTFSFNHFGSLLVNNTVVSVTFSFNHFVTFSFNHSPLSITQLFLLLSLSITLFLLLSLPLTPPCQ